jgi:hypothetical protein
MYVKHRRGDLLFFNLKDLLAIIRSQIISMRRAQRFCHGRERQIESTGRTSVVALRRQ